MVPTGTSGEPVGEYVVCAFAICSRQAARTVNSRNALEPMHRAPHIYVVHRNVGHGHAHSVQINGFSSKQIEANQRSRPKGVGGKRKN